MFGYVTELDTAVGAVARALKSEAAAYANSLTIFSSVRAAERAPEGLVLPSGRVLTAGRQDNGAPPAGEDVDHKEAGEPGCAPACRTSGRARAHGQSLSLSCAAEATRPGRSAGITRNYPYRGWKTQIWDVRRPAAGAPLCTRRSAFVHDERTRRCFVTLTCHPNRAARASRASCTRRCCRRRCAARSATSSTTSPVPRPARRLGQGRDAEGWGRTAGRRPGCA
jgi:hypothetical protein